jgi:formylglycine-generating enzyme required for sulfatase activity
MPTSKLLVPLLCAVACVVGRPALSAADAEPSSRPASRPTAGMAPGATWVERIPHTDLALELAYVPAGALPPDVVGGARVGPLWVSTCEVTWDLFEQFAAGDPKLVEAAGGTLAADDPLRRAARVPRPYTFKTVPAADLRARPATPVSFVSQIAAQRFCQWLTIRTGRPYRLPTEAEWEHACRAGTRTRYFFGDDPARLGEYAWFGGAATPEKVGQKRPNPWGLRDVYGNVAEWTLDGWAADGAGPARAAGAGWTPRGPTQDRGAIRGGDGASPADECRSGWRYGLLDWSVWATEEGWGYFHGAATEPGSERSWRVGFRVVSPVQAPPAVDQMATSVDPASYASYPERSAQK